MCPQHSAVVLKLFSESIILKAAPLIRTEHRRLREFFQHFYPKCNINWGFQLFWSAYKPKTKNNFFGPKSAVQSQFLGKCLGLEKNFISQILFKI